jgi:hypothetical protein
MTSATRERLLCAAATLALASSCYSGGDPSGPDPSAEIGETSPELLLSSLKRRSSTPSFCFVYLPAKVTGYSAADFWTEASRIEGILTQWENASNLRINWVSGDGSGHHVCAGTGAEDVRILLYNTGVNQGDPIPSVPGKTCGHSEDVQTTKGARVTWDFGSGPDADAGYRACVYNARLGLGASINQYLHETGHSLNLSHEHDRTDNNNASCPGSAKLGPPSNPFLTSYDVYSVMHYNWNGDPADPWKNCPAPGNWGNTGLSPVDLLGMEMMYPKSRKPVLAFPTIVRQGQAAGGTFDWILRGAYSTWLKSPSFTVTGIGVATPSPSQKSGASAQWSAWPVGAYSIRATFTDGWGDAHQSDTRIDVYTHSYWTAIFTPVLSM